jgi:hypothetical protein
LRNEYEAAHGKVKITQNVSFKMPGCNETNKLMIAASSSYFHKPAKFDVDLESMTFTEEGYATIAHMVVYRWVEKGEIQSSAVIEL